MSTALPAILAITTAACYLSAIYWRSRQPQHAGGSEVALTVWEVIAYVEAEREQQTQSGRHRLREPPPESTQDNQVPAPPPLELQQRILEALHRL
ncbi:hypothetical protein [Saccharopolyspora shandongensis]|uniref:hypothetical protein n=1 Tax=Saccharopolyspora shandongensis TaxID=418495 RepID=UPI0033DCF4C0